MDTTDRFDAAFELCEAGVMLRKSTTIPAVFAPDLTRLLERMSRLPPDCTTSIDHNTT